jgi:hypothetical protein
MIKNRHFILDEPSAPLEVRFVQAPYLLPFLQDQVDSHIVEEFFSLLLLILPEYRIF